MARALESANIAAEFVGTLLLVFLGSFAQIYHNDDPLDVGVCIMFLYIFLTYSLHATSGAHFNPAISCYYILTGDFYLKKGLVYIATQFGASIVGGCMVWL